MNSQTSKAHTHKHTHYLLTHCTVSVQAAASIFGVIGGPLLGLFTAGILCPFVNATVSLSHGLRRDEKLRAEVHVCVKMSCRVVSCHVKLLLILCSLSLLVSAMLPKNNLLAFGFPLIHILRLYVLLCVVLCCAHCLMFLFVV